MKVLARRVSAFAARAMFLVALFFIVVLLQVALTTGFIANGLASGWALLASGAIISASVAASTFALNRNLRARFSALERARVRLGLPHGPCCVVWRGGADVEMPWVLRTPIEARFPDVARRIGVEGLAVLDFAVDADGAPHDIRCLDVWPAPVFAEAAIAALSAARFAPAPGATPDLAQRYQAPFIFRIRGAASVADRALRARTLS